MHRTPFWLLCEAYEGERVLCAFNLSHGDAEVPRCNASPGGKPARLGGCGDAAMAAEVLTLSASLSLPGPRFCEFAKALSAASIGKERILRRLGYSATSRRDFISAKRCRFRIPTGEHARHVDAQLSPSPRRKLLLGKGAPQNGCRRLGQHAGSLRHAQPL